jgi:O-antigen/teichoic acid export membrane protein
VNIFDPILNITAVFLLVPFLGIRAVAVSYLISNILKACVLLGYLRVKTPWRPTMVFYHPKMPELLGKSSRTGISGFIWSLRDVIIRNMASRLGEGAVTLFSYAEKIVNILINLIIVPLAKVFYARISEWVSLSKWKDVRFLFSRAATINLSAGLFTASGCILFLPSLLSLFFHGSKFTAEDIGLLSALFNVMLGYFVIMSFQVYAERVIYAVKRTGVIIFTTLAGVGFLGCAAYVLSKAYGIYGLTVSIVVTQAFVCLLYYIFARRLADIGFGELGKELLSAFSISVILTVVGLATMNFINDYVLNLFIVLPLWLMLYLLSARIFLKEHLKILFSK